MPTGQSAPIGRHGDRAGGDEHASANDRLCVTGEQALTPHELWDYPLPPLCHVGHDHAHVDQLLAAGEGPTPEQIVKRLRRINSPDNEVPAAVGWAAMLGRSTDAAVALVAARAYTTGVQLDMVVRIRQAPRPGEERHVSAGAFGHRRGDGADPLAARRRVRRRTHRHQRARAQSPALSGDARR